MKSLYLMGGHVFRAALCLLALTACSCRHSTLPPADGPSATTRQVGRGTAVSAASESPFVHRSSGQLSALVYLPDRQSGHYRGARFDWSSMIGRNAIAVEGNAIRLTNLLQDGASVNAPLLHEDPPKEFMLVKPGLRMKVRYDFAPSRVVLLGLANVISVEPFMSIALEPGEQVKWPYGYDFSVSIDRLGDCRLSSQLVQGYSLT